MVLIIRGAHRRLVPILELRYLYSDDQLPILGLRDYNVLKGFALLSSSWHSEAHLFSFFVDTDYAILVCQ